MHKTFFKTDLLDNRTKPTKEKKVYNIPKISHKKKGTTRRSLNSEIIQAVYTRDGFKCILCDGKLLDIPHHIYYGINANYGENRNDLDQLVTLCKDCHYTIHNKSGGIELNNKCINYIGKQ